MAKRAWIGTLIISSVMAFLAERPAGAAGGLELGGAGWLDLPGRPAGFAGADVLDLDGDRLPDVVASFGGTPASLRTYLAGAPGSWPAEAGSVEAPFAGGVRLADLTGDGLVDAVVLSTTSPAQAAVFEGDRKGGFRLRSTVAAGKDVVIQQVATEDVDGDGIRDLTIAGGAPCIAYGPGFAASESLGSTPAANVAIVDIDGDGRRDIVLSSSTFTAALFIYQAKGGRSYRAWTVLIENGGSYPSPVVPVDADGDGMPELAIATDEGLLAARVVPGEFQWTADPILLRIEGSLVSYWPFLLEDLDGDGAEDLVRTDHLDRISLVFGSRQAGALVLDGEALTSTVPGASTHLTGARDIDGDGVREIFLGRFFFRIGPGRRFIAPALLDPISNWLQGKVLDLDGDGTDDLVMANSGQLAIFLGGPAGLVATHRLEIHVGRPRAMAVGRLRPAGPIEAIFMDAVETDIVEFDPTGLPFTAKLDFDRPGVLPGGLSLDPWTDGSPRLLAIRRISSGPDAGLTVLSVLDGSLTETARIAVPPGSADPRAADLDGDGWTDLLLASPGGNPTARIDGGLRVFRGGPSGPRYPAVVGEPWDWIRCLAAVDADGDGIEELAATGISGGANAVRLFRRAGNGWTSEALSSEPIVDLRSADLDGDGRADLVGGGAAGFEVFWGEGGRLLPKMAVAAPMASFARGSLEIADLDGDGLLDLIGEGIVSHGGPGRSFEMVREILPLGVASDSIILAGDIDGDGREDLLVRSRGSYSVSRREAGGAFGTAIDVPGLGAAPDRPAFADLDGDGRADLAAVPAGSTSIVFLRGRGDGTFEDPIRLPGEAGRIVLASGDIDGDGDADLLAGHDGGPGADLHRGGPGFGTSAPEGLPASGTVTHGAIADLDGDGNADVAVAGYGVMEAFPGRGAGAPGGPVPLPDLVVYLLGDLLADIDGDGVPDTIHRIGTSAMEVLLGKGGFTFAAGPASEFPPYASPSALADFDGDGRPDLLGRVGGRLFVMKGLGGGAFGRPRIGPRATPALLLDIDGDGRRDLVVSPSSTEGPSHVGAVPAGDLLAWPHQMEEAAGAAAGDFDGDGRMEIAGWRMSDRAILFVAEDSHREVRRSGVASAVSLPAGARSLAAADLDGDGRSDLAVLQGGSVSWLRSAGGFAFDPPTSIAEGAAGWGLDFPDLDGDRLPDLIVDGFFLALGLGGGHFGPLRSYRFGDAPSTTAAGNFDGDGVIEIAQTLGGSPSRLVGGDAVLIADGDGTGRFDAPECLDLGGSVRDLSTPTLPPFGLAIGDFDGNGRLDVAGAIGEFFSVTPAPRVWYGADGGGLVRGPDLADPTAPITAALHLRAEDLDGDGFDDLLAATALGALLVYRGGPGGLGEAGPISAGPAEAAVLATGRFRGPAGPLSIAVAGAAGLFLVPIEVSSAEVLFRRGDADGSGKVEVTDAIAVLLHLFLGGDAPSCPAAADASGAGGLSITDPIVILRYLFLGGSPPPAPGPDACGLDPAPDPSLGPCAYPAAACR